MHYSALLDGSDGAYGVVFPDLPGCTAMGDTVADVLRNAQEAARAWSEAIEARGETVPAPRSPDAILKDADVRQALSDGASLIRVLLIRELGRPSKANMSLDSGILASIDATAKSLGITRSALIERMAIEKLPEYA